MKKTVVIVMVLFLNIGLIGCSEEKQSQSNKDNSATAGNLADGNNEATNQDDEVVDSDITNEGFLKAIRQLKPDSNVSDDLIKNQTVQQLKVHHKKDYYIVWTEYQTASPDLPVVAIFNAQKEPIYIKSFRERIESVKYIGEFMLDKGLIEVTSYGASGSFSGQWVNLLMLNNDAVNEIWEYQTIGNESHLSDEEGVMEYLHDYSTYLLIPTYQQRFSDDNKNKIIVNHTSEKILVGEEEKVVSRNHDIEQLSYIWDEEQLEFVKEE